MQPLTPPFHQEKRFFNQIVWNQLPKMGTDFLFITHRKIRTLMIGIRELFLNIHENLN